MVCFRNVSKLVKASLVALVFTVFTIGAMIYRTGEFSGKM